MHVPIPNSLGLTEIPKLTLTVRLGRHNSTVASATFTYASLLKLNGAFS